MGHGHANAIVAYQLPQEGLTMKDFIIPDRDFGTPAQSKRWSR